MRAGKGVLLLFGSAGWSMWHAGSSSNRTCSRWVALGCMDNTGPCACVCIHQYDVTP